MTATIKQPPHTHFQQGPSLSCRGGRDEWYSKRDVTSRVFVTVTLLSWGFGQADSSC